MELADDILWAIIPLALVIIFGGVTLTYFPDIWGRLMLGFIVIVLVVTWYRPHRS